MGRIYKNFFLAKKEKKKLLRTQRCVEEETNLNSDLTLSFLVSSTSIGTFEL